MLLLGIFGFVYMHEQVHVAINDWYGMNSTVSYFSDFPRILTIADSRCPNDVCSLAHNITEIVGYHLLVIFCLCSVGFLFLIFILEQIHILQQHQPQRYIIKKIIKRTS